MTVDTLLEQARQDDMARLRWLLCRTFGVAPWSKLGRSLSEADCLALAAQLVLDGEAPGPAVTENPAFDSARFQRMKGAGA